MREIPEITKDLTAAAEDAKKKKKAHDDAAKALEKAGIEYTNAQNEVGKLQEELRQSLEVLMPGLISNPNVRQS